MNSKKICTLREKYADQSFWEVDDPEDKKVLKELVRQ